MQLGIGRQISNLSKAAATKNIGSQASFTAMAKAQSVAIGKDTTRAAMPASNAVTHLRPRSAIRGSVHPGNTAGMQNAKSTLLNVNDTGYDNRNYQKARYSKANITYPKIIKSNYVNMSNSRTTDYRVGKRSTDSPSRLKNRGM